jgi:hypothetical protein
VIEMSRDWINEKAGQLAYDLDNGGGDLVAAKLRQDSIRLPEQEFARLVYLTHDYENKSQGDDLNIRPVQGGEVVSVDAVRSDRRGNLYRDRIPAGEIEFTPIYDEPYQRNGGGIDRRSAVIGGIIGAVAGAVIKHQIDDHRDNRRDNNRRENDWDHRDRDHHRDNDRDHRDNDRRHHHDNRRR